MYSRRFRKQLRKIHITQQPTDHLLRGILRAAAVFLAISLGFSTAMVTNQINYIPDGYQLVYQSNLPLMKKFRYKNSENTSITIQVSPGNGSNNYNTENSEIKSCMIGEKNVLYWEKDGVRMCVIKEGEWLISVVTELPFNEVFKIVENINYCNWHVPKVSFDRYIDEKDKGGRVYEKTQQIKTLMLTANIAKLFIPIEICFADMILVFYEGY